MCVGVDYLEDGLFRDADTAWQVAARHLPELNAQVATILADEFPGESF